jgi:hypothetical protein
MERDFLRVRSVQVGLGALVIALVLFGWAAARANRIDPVDPAAEPRFATSDALVRAGMMVPPDVGTVASLNVFSPDRKAPAVRYRLNGYTEATPQTDLPKPVVIGTYATADNRSFAYVSVGDSRANIVRAGEKVGVYTVKSIERGRVTFVTPSGELLVINAR